MPRTLGSQLAIILGILYFVAQVSVMKVAMTAGQSGSIAADGGLVAGPVMIFGGLACLSAKRRLLGYRGFRALRILFELAVMGLVVLSVVSRSDLKYAIATNPFPTLVIPVWAVFAYLMTVAVTSPRTSPVGSSADDSNATGVKVSVSNSGTFENTNDATDDEIYDAIGREISDDKMHLATWTRAFSEADGLDVRARSIYIKRRFMQIKASSSKGNRP